MYADQQIHGLSSKKGRYGAGSYISSDSLKPVWCLSVLVQSGDLLRVSLAAQTAEAATIEGRCVTKPYCISDNSAKKKTMFSICIQT